MLINFLRIMTLAEGSAYNTLISLQGVEPLTLLITILSEKLPLLNTIPFIKVWSLSHTYLKSTESLY